MKADLVKTALDSGCAYLPPGENIEPLYIFSLIELALFAQNILNKTDKTKEDKNER